LHQTRFCNPVAAARASDEEATLDRIHAALQQLSAEDLCRFQQRYDRLLRRADRGDVYAAALLLNGGYCSDDGFTDFRAWLIARGRAEFERALDHPDSLAEMDLCAGDDVPQARFEAFGYVAAKAGEMRHEDDFHDWMRDNLPDTDAPEPSPPPYDWQTYTDAVLEQRLPALWMRYGRFKQEAEAQQTDSPAFAGAVVITGLGRIQVGSTLIHRSFGAGRIRLLSPLPGDIAMATIAFDDAERPMLLGHDPDLWRLP
jgi:hypothetical protein